MFLNCTAHSLTEEQKEEAKKLDPVPMDLQDLSPELHKRLLNCPSDYDGIILLLREFCDYLSYIKKKAKGEEIYLHFPVGSPFFMASFFSYFKKKGFNFVFSHSDRVSVDEKQEDGTVVKRAVFRFVKFLILQGH